MPLSKPIAKSISTMMPMTIEMVKESFSIFSSRGILALLFLERSCAIFPASVSLPMLETTPVPLPEEMYVPAKSMFFLSGSNSFALSLRKRASLLTSPDSPVSKASSTLRFFVSISLMSAATLVPGSNMSMSPGTM